MGDFKSFTKEEHQARILNLIRKMGPPKQLNRLRYRNFKGESNLILRYETEEDTEDNQEIII